MTVATYSVTGMSCEHCVAAVRAEVGKLPDVTEVEVDLATGTMRVHSRAAVSDPDVLAAVDEAGYEATRQP